MKIFKRILLRSVQEQCVTHRYSHSVVNDVRVRFAPSPTGYLHLGGLRTALYNYLFAKANKGRFLLRMEDTDQSRLVKGAAEQLKSDLIWAGIEIDEGPGVGGHFGPYTQSERLHIYKEQVNVLLENGSAYKCFCSERRLEILRKEALKLREIPKYDNKCRYLTKDEAEEKLAKGEKSCVRFKLTEGVEEFDDLIYGRISYDVAANEGDPVIIKADGFPTYHFANVVDDHFMQISHVLRGVEWQISTPKHIMMYRAFSWNPPSFGHLPLLLNADGTKLSKRQGDIKIKYYRDEGIFPLALINFIVSSGGGFEKDLERGVKPKCYTIDELVQQFKIENINSHSGKLKPDRLFEFNRLELERKLQNTDDTNELVKLMQGMIEEKYGSRIPKTSLQLNEEYIKTILKWSVNRIHRLEDLFLKDLQFIWIIPTTTEVLEQNQLTAIITLAKTFSEQEVWDKESATQFLKSFAKENNIKYNILMKSLRTVLSGLKEGPSVAEMIEILGKQNTLQRMQTYIERVKK